MEINILSLGAGVQSSTLALMAACGEITPMPVAAVFADTQAEPVSVYGWLDWLEKQLPFPVVRATAGNLGADSTRLVTSKRSGKTYLKTRVPYFAVGPTGKKGMNQRHCTRDYKISVVRREVKKIMREYGATSVRKVWPVAGMTVGGRLYELPILAPRTTETVGGSSPTIPTPTVKGNYNRAGASPSAGNGLATWVTMFPTATAYGSNRGGSAGREGPERLSLQSMAKTGLWPTPTARDHKSGKASAETHARNARPISEQVGGLLNADWCEWLMALPIGWTVCAPSVMPWCRLRRGPRFKFLRG